jgi:hypothetical protein
MMEIWSSQNLLLLQLMMHKILFYRGIKTNTGLFIDTYIPEVGKLLWNIPKCRLLERGRLFFNDPPKGAAY